jgi:hypothetical protein
MTLFNKSINIYWNKNDWDNDNKLNTKIEAIDFIDYLKQRLGINYIDFEELNKKYRFLNHNEYILFHYFKYLFEYYRNNEYPNNLIIVDDESKADIKILKIEESSITLENLKNNRIIKFGNENDKNDYPIPYFTGIYTFTENTELFKSNCQRKYLLSYIGGSWRGPRDVFGKPKRATTITNFNDFSNINTEKNKLYNKLFYCPLLANSHSEESLLGWNEGSFGIKAKEVYWNSVFSWHPNGDSLTRKGFYESILLGNIPIINESSYSVYKHLLIGDENIKKIAIILEDNHFFDANFVFNHLLSMNDDEIYERRNNINKISNQLQWGFTTDKNILNDILEKVLESN